MKILIHSKKLNEQIGTCWFRGGEKISYFENTIKKVQKCKY